MRVATATLRHRLGYRRVPAWHRLALSPSVGVRPGLSPITCCAGAVPRLLGLRIEEQAPHSWALLVRADLRMGLTRFGSLPVMEPPRLHVPVLHRARLAPRARAAQRAIPLRRRSLALRRLPPREKQPRVTQVLADLNSATGPSRAIRHPALLIGLLVHLARGIQADVSYSRLVAPALASSCMEGVVSTLGLVR